MYGSLWFPSWIFQTFYGMPALLRKYVFHTGNEWNHDDAWWWKWKCTLLFLLNVCGYVFQVKGFHDLHEMCICATNQPQVIYSSKDSWVYSVIHGWPEIFFHVTHLLSFSLSLCSLLSLTMFQCLCILCPWVSSVFIFLGQVTGAYESVTFTHTRVTSEPACVKTVWGSWRTWKEPLQTWEEHASIYIIYLNI